MQYQNIDHKIIAEKYMIEDDMVDLPDYKFFCFDGVVYCSYTMIDYTHDHSNGKIGFFDRDYNLLPYYRKDYSPITKQMPKPENYEKMVEIAERLSVGFAHVRVDLYDIKGKVYFGEMTFTNASGFTKYVPEEFDYILGRCWKMSL